MERFFASDDTHLENSDKTLTQIKYARILTDRILADEYYKGAWMEHDRKWGELVLGSTPSDDGLTSVMTMDYPNVKTEKDRAQERRDNRIALMRLEKAKQRDIDELFAIMANHIQGWWD